MGVFLSLLGVIAPSGDLTEESMFNKRFFKSNDPLVGMLNTSVKESFQDTGIAEILKEILPVTNFSDALRKTEDEFLAGHESDLFQRLYIHCGGAL
jgi:hypothetical protein